MTIFAVLMPDGSQSGLVAKIKAEFPNDSYEVTSSQWLVSASGTALDVTTRLGIFDPKNTDAPVSGLGIVFATSSYHGRAPTPVWDWIKNKLEAKVSG